MTNIMLEGPRPDEVILQITIRTMVPIGLRAAASIQKNNKHCHALIGAALRCENEGTRESVEAAGKTVSAVPAAYADDAFVYASAAAYATEACAAAAAGDAIRAVALVAEAFCDATQRRKVLTAFGEAVARNGY